MRKSMFKETIEHMLDVINVEALCYPNSRGLFVDDLINGLEIKGMKFDKEPVKSLSWEELKSLKIHTSLCDISESTGSEYVDASFLMYDKEHNQVIVRIEGKSVDYLEEWQAKYWSLK